MRSRRCGRQARLGARPTSPLAGLAGTGPPRVVIPHLGERLGEADKLRRIKARQGLQHPQLVQRTHQVHARNLPPTNGFCLLRIESTYYRLGPAFDRLLLEQGGDLEAFCRSVKTLAKLPPAVAVVTQNAGSDRQGPTGNYRKTHRPVVQNLIEMPTTISYVLGRMEPILAKVFHPFSSLPRALAAALLWLAVAASAHAQGTGFTFQGRLTDGGVPANGQYDFQFALRDALTAGNAVGATLTMNPVGVTNGLFNVTLDFGAGAFNGTACWLEIGARTNGSLATHTVLTPRTPVSAVPYAMFANTEALAAQVTALAGQLATLSNHFSTNIPAGVPVVSGDALEPAFLAQGLQNFQTVPAPPWINGTATEVPSGRSGYSAVWTGQQLLVWGGDLGGPSYSANGGAYATASDLWTSFSAFKSPSGRAGHTAVWTGTEMVIWGGFGSAGYAPTNSRYHLGKGEWAAVSPTAAPAGRVSHAALWTGTRMIVIVFGGRNSVGLLADGGVYDPTGDGWSALPATGAPEARQFATAVWTGTRGIFWGGQGNGGELANGGRLECDAGGVPQSWATVATTSAPSARTRHTAVWTGTNMIVWGGQQGGAYVGDGAAYNPASDSWTSLPAVGAPVARANHVAVWSGTEMLIYGGEDNTGSLASGAAYDPVKNNGVTFLPLEMVGDYSGLGQPGKRTRIDLTLGEDSNGNGLPDAWERAMVAARGWNASLTNLTANSSPGGNGVTLLQEYVAGTYGFEDGHGLNLAIASVEAGVPVLEFLAVRGRNYATVGSSNLKTWAPVPFRLRRPDADSDLVNNYLSPEVRLLQVSVPAPATGAAPLFYKLQIQ